MFEKKVENNYPVIIRYPVSGGYQTLSGIRLRPDSKSLSGTPLKRTQNFQSKVTADTVKVGILAGANFLYVTIRAKIAQTAVMLNAMIFNRVRV